MRDTENLVHAVRTNGPEQWDFACPQRSSLLVGTAVLLLVGWRERLVWIESEVFHELAMLAVQSRDNTGWLPGVITTAALVAAGDDEPGFVVTDEGLEALAAS